MVERAEMLLALIALALMLFLVSPSSYMAAGNPGTVHAVDRSMFRLLIATLAMAALAATANAQVYPGDLTCKEYLSEPRSPPGFDWLYGFVDGAVMAARVKMPPMPPGEFADNFCKNNPDKPLSSVGIAYVNMQSLGIGKKYAAVVGETSEDRLC